VKSVDYWAYYSRHHIDLVDYLEQNYGLTFHDAPGQKICDSDPALVLNLVGPHENLWLRSNIPSSQVNEHDIKPRYGNVLTWEAIENNCPIVEAVPLVLKKSKGLQPYRSARLGELDWIGRKTAKRLSIGRAPSVNTYLEERNIDHSQLNTVFKIGAPLPYQQLAAFFSQTKYTSDELKSMLKAIFISERPYGYKYFPREPSVAVPVYSEKKEFVGFHGRFIDSNKSGMQRYFNTGYLDDLHAEVLYGLHIDQINQAIGQNKQVIVTRGMFELFACYQNGSKQVISTLNQGVSSNQFEKIMNLPINEVIAGFTAPRERQVILGLIHQSLKKVNLSLTPADKELDIELGNGSSLSSIISACLKNLLADEDAIRLASIKRRNENMTTLTQMGGYFLINKADLLEKVAGSKRLIRNLKSFIDSNFKKATRTLPKATGFVKMANTLASGAVIDSFGAELRTLIFLMCKVNPKLGVINYTQTALCKDLGISQGTLIKHVKILTESKYLLVHRKTTRKAVGRKNKIQRSVTFRYYPSTIPFT
jgi:hypothetical protein